MLGKSYEYWIAVIAATLWVWRKHEEFPFSTRITMVAVSAGAGLGLSPALAERANLDETLVAFVVITFGYLMLDFGGSLFANNGEFIRDMIKRRSDK